MIGDDKNMPSAFLIATIILYKGCIVISVFDFLAL